MRHGRLLALVVGFLVSIQGSFLEAQRVPFLRGDTNADGVVDISDGVATLAFLFLGAAEPICLDAADTNDSGVVDMSDSIALFSYLFLGGRHPASPGAKECGLDPTKDPLGCVSFPPCESNACPDPAATDIEFTIMRRTSPFAGVVRVRGKVRNLGGFYGSRPNQQALLLFEVPLGGSPRLVSTQTFTDLAPGEEVVVDYARPWNSSSPSEGEFPPSYRLIITYDPDITLDGNPDNDDCVSVNNRRERSGQGINELFRE